MEKGRISKKRSLFWCVESLSPAGGGYICEGGRKRRRMTGWVRDYQAFLGKL